MLMIPARWILHKILNHLLQCQLWVRLDLSISETVAPTTNSWDDRDPLTTQHEQFCPYSLLQRSPLFCFWLRQLPCWYFSSFPILSPMKLLQLVFFIAWSIGINLRTRLLWLNDFSFSCNMIFMILVKRSFHVLPRRFIGLNNASVFDLAIVFNAIGFPVLLTFKFARHLRLASELPTFYAHSSW